MSCVVRRLVAVRGYENRVNDIIFAAKTTEEIFENVSIFFGGDVQDYPENMKSHRDHGAYVNYNLEATAELLATKLNHPVVVVRPSRINLKTFSCYDNFVSCDSVGSPDHQPDFKALQHLALLFEKAGERISEMKLGCIDKSKLTLIGFSKGCVVLNQFLHEFHNYSIIPASSDSPVPSFINRISKMVWLDGGHSGGKQTWVTSKSILTSFAKMDVPIEVNVTPYQIKDSRRPWIGQEEKLFCSTLQKLGVNLSRTLYLDEEPPSLDNHFCLLNMVFMS